MKAVFFREHGDVGVLEYGELPLPVMAADEVLVRIRSCSMNFVDILVRRGLPGIKSPLPLIVGVDGAGVIENIGSEIEGYHVGQRVCIEPFRIAELSKSKCLGKDKNGVMAEYVSVHHSQLIPIPDNVSFEDASCLPSAYASAHRMLFARGHVQSGETVLIFGGSGGVGSAALRLAKLAGARVIAAAGSAEKCARLLQIGADEVINYNESDIVAEVRARTGGGLLSGGGYDVVLNSTGGTTWMQGIQCLKYHGRLLMNGALLGECPSVDLRYIFSGELSIIGSTGWTRSDDEALIAMVATGRLKPLIDRTVRLDEAIEAYNLLERREIIGKVVVNV